MRGDGGEEIAAVEGVATARTPPTLVIKDHHSGNAAERLRGGKEEPVVWADQDVSADATNGDRSALRPNAWIDHRHMCPNRKMNERLNKRLGTSLNVIRRNCVGEVERPRVGCHRQDNTREDASRWIAQSEIGHERDQAQASVHWTERINHVVILPLARAGHLGNPKNVHLLWNLLANEALHSEIRGEVQDCVRNPETAAEFVVCRFCWVEGRDRQISCAKRKW